MAAHQKFDGLADDYDRHRPRYPEQVFSTIAGSLPSFAGPTVVDAGAGTGIALEGLIPALGEDARCLAVDVSEDMVRTGREKFPDVEWTVGPAEPFLEELAAPVQLIITAQAYQWLDRPRFVSAAIAALAPRGVVAVMQNNRDHSDSVFLDSYEALLERHSPGYSRGYRDFDIAAELAADFGPAGGHVQTSVVEWSASVRIDAFVRMSASSTQVQRAVAEEGEGFLDRVRELAEKHAHHQRIDIPYRSELFLGVLP